MPLIIKPYNRADARWKCAPFGGWRHHLYPKGKHVTGFSVAFGSLQHGYHRLTGFSGRLGSPTNPVRWSDSSSFATPVQGALWVLSSEPHDTIGRRGT